MRAGGGGGGRKLEALVHREIGGGQQREPFRGAQRCGTAGHEAGEARSALAQLLREPLPQAALATGVTAATQHNPHDPTGTSGIITGTTFTSGAISRSELLTAHRARRRGGGRPAQCS